MSAHVRVSDQLALEWNLVKSTSLLGLTQFVAECCSEEEHILVGQSSTELQT